MEKDKGLTVCTKMGADSLAKNSQNAPIFFGQICLPKPKSLGFSKKALSGCPSVIQLNPKAKYNFGC